MPFLKKTITGWMLDEVRNRHKNALIEAGGEPVLLYMPDGHKLGAAWDDVRQSYKKSDRKYELYLNRDRDRFGKRLYTDDTRLVPSCLVAFPLNPDKEQLREEGFLLSNNSNAWTLWSPVIVPKESFIIRDNQATGEKEYWVVDSTLFSTFPGAPRDINKMLHQEMYLTKMTPESMHVDQDQILSVDETLTKTFYPLTSSVGGITQTTGTATFSSGSCLIAGNSVWSVPTNDLFSSLSVDIRKVSSTGVFSIVKPCGDDNEELRIDLNLSNNTVSLLFDDVLGQSKPLTVSSEVFTSLKIFFEEPYIEILSNGVTIIKHSFTSQSAYTNAKPLKNASTLISHTGSGNIRLRSLRFMEIL